MEICATVKKNLALFGIVDSARSQGYHHLYLARRIIALVVLYSVSILGMWFLLFEAQTFREKAESILPCLVEINVTTTYTVLVVQQPQFFTLFNQMELRIRKRMCEY